MKLLHFLVCQFTVSLTAFSSMSFHVVGTNYCFCVRLLPNLVIFQLLQQKYVIHTSLYIVQKLFHKVCSRAGFLFVSLCIQNNLLFALNLLYMPSWDRLELIPFFIHCSFYIRIFHRLEHRKNLCTKFVMGHGSKSFACNVGFMIFRLRRFRSLPRGFMKFHFTTINRLWSLLGYNLRLCKHFRDAIWSSFTRHDGCHRSFQFSSRIFVSFFVILVFRTNEVNSSQLSAFEHCPVLAFLLSILVFIDSERLHQFSSILQAILDLVW